MRILLLLLAFLVSAVLGLAAEQKSAAGKVKVTLKDANGKQVGTAVLSPAKPGVAISATFSGLPEGEHALHIHQNAVCEADPAKPADAFKSAGPHFNPEHKKRGLNNPEGPHAGDMENVTVQKGTSKAKVVDTRVSLDPAAANSVLANGGTALVIHEKADDGKTDPAGNAGARIGCGVIKM